MAQYGGIDLHSNNLVVALTDDNDQVVYRKRLPNDAAVVLTALAPHQALMTGLVVEWTYNWYWRVDALNEAGYRVHLANTAAIVQYSGLKYGDDDSDACWLAKLLRLGLLPEVTVQINLLVMRAQEAAIDLLEQQACAQVRARPADRHLLTLCGIGQVLGLTILLETGPVAIKAVAHKLARACYSILRDGTDFEVNRAFA